MTAPTPEQIAAANTEEAHQSALFCALALRAVTNDDLRWIHAVPNGGERSASQGARLKAAGARAGVWDVFVPVPRKYFHGMYLEMKAPVGKTKTGKPRPKGKLSDEQIAFGLWAHQRGYHTSVAFTWDEALKQILDYLAGAAPERR